MLVAATLNQKGAGYGLYSPRSVQTAFCWSSADNENCAIWVLASVKGGANPVTPSSLLGNPSTTKPSQIHSARYEDLLLSLHSALVHIASGIRLIVAATCRSPLLRHLERIQASSLLLLKTMFTWTKYSATLPFALSPKHQTMALFGGSTKVWT